MIDDGYVRKAFRSAQDDIVDEIKSWDVDSVNPDMLLVWKERLLGLQGMISRVAQETEMHRRQIMVIKSEMDMFDRSARSIKILDVGASRVVAEKADLMRKDLDDAKTLLAEMEADEIRLEECLAMAKQKIEIADTRSNDNINNSDGTRPGD